MHTADTNLINAERCERYARSCVLPQERASFEALAAELRRAAREDDPDPKTN